MATLHPIFFPDLLDSIIVAIIKAISSKVRTNVENISKHRAGGCCSPFRNGFNYTNHGPAHSRTGKKDFLGKRMGML